MVIFTHLCNLQSFGVPYLAPLTPFRARDMGDYIYRKSWRWMRERPLLIANKNIVRQQGVESKEDGRR